MALVPLESLYKAESKILISASLDKFEYDSTLDLELTILRKRQKRLEQLELTCNKSRRD